MNKIVYNNQTYIGKWSKIDTVLIYKFNFNYQKCNNVLGFDLDDTLVSTKSGKVFAENSEDWKIIFNSKEKLNEEFKNGKNIFIFSNQSEIEKKGESYEKLVKNKFEQIIKTINLPITAYISTTHDKYRKPNVFMFDLMLNQFYDNNLNLIESFIYVGDAAGRPKRKGYKKDFSCSDRKFAYNINIYYKYNCELNNREYNMKVYFKTPNEYFENKQIELFEWNEIEPNKIKTDLNIDFKPSDNQEMIILVGYPASGKSTFYENILKPLGYINISQDILKTSSKCILETKKAIKDKKSVVIDNTNPSKSARLQYIQLSKYNNIDVRCIYFNVDDLTAKHMNNYRINTINRKIPNIVYNIFNKQFEKPTIEEGFKEIIEINLIINSNKIDKRYFYMKY